MGRSGSRGSCVTLPPTAVTLRPPSAPGPPNQCKRPAERNQHSAKPDQGHERLPPQPHLPSSARVGLADDGVKLAIPEGLDRCFAGLGWRIREIAGLRLQRLKSLPPACMDFCLYRSPVLARCRNDIAEFDRPRADAQRLALLHHRERLPGEGAVNG